MNFKEYVLSGRFDEVAGQAVADAIAQAKAHGLESPAVPALRQSPLDQDSLDLIERDLIVAPVREPGGV